MQPSIQMLAQGEIEQIDATSRRILHEVGILVENRDALELFQDAGAKVDFEKKLVKISPDVIDSAIEKCEPYVSLYGRGDRESTFPAIWLSSTIDSTADSILINWWRSYCLTLHERHQCRRN